MSAAPVVFLGPSLPHAEARARLRFDAELRPPVRRGDIDALDPDVELVCIVDGVFFTRHAVSAREILGALRRGVRVIGASSMGALRAAELEPYGMEGVGEIWRMYRDGEIDSDAEVGLSFDPESLRPLTEPLVNVRRMAAAAVDAGLLDAGAAATLLTVAREIHFMSLTYPALLRRAAGRLPEPKLEALRAFIRERGSALDAKRADALAAIDHLNALVMA